MGIAIMRSGNIWEPRKAFFCCKITTGGLFIGWLHLILNIISSLSLMYAPVVGYSSVLAISVVTFLMNVVGIITSFLLLVGVSEDNPTFMMPFIVFRIIHAVISSLAGVGLFIYWVSNLSTFSGFVMLNLFTLLTVQVVYEILIVRACRMKVQRREACESSNNQQGPYKQFENVV